MLGAPKRLQPKLFYSGVSLDERIPPAHLLRRVRQTVDFDFIRHEVAQLYGPCGHESLDPAVLLKLMLLLFLENVSSERALAEQLPYRLDWLWFCEYDLDEETPNHSVLSKARRRWGVEVFSEFFQRVLQQCVAAGLVDGQTLHVDASVIRANADSSGLQPALRVAAGALYDRLEQEAEDPGPSAAAEEEAAPHGPGDDGPPPRTLVSATDPDARLTRKGGQSILGYKDHRVVDDRCGIVTATVTTDAATAESHVIDEALDQHEQNVGCRPRTVAADKAYGTAGVYQSMAARGVTPCIPHQRHTGRWGVGIYESKDFHYDAGRDAYRCPQDQWLEHHSTRQDGSRRYRAAKGVCAACPRREQCTQANDGRWLSRHVGQEWIDWADGCYSREHRHRLGRRRMYRAEGSFADAANRHGYKRARWRELAGMTIQNLLIAAAQNLRKLLRACRRKPALALAGFSLACRPLTFGGILRHPRVPTGCRAAFRSHPTMLRKTTRPQAVWS
jgi:transposase